MVIYLDVCAKFFSFAELKIILIPKDIFFLIGLKLSDAFFEMEKFSFVSGKFINFCFEIEMRFFSEWLFLLFSSSLVAYIFFN